MDELEKYSLEDKRKETSGKSAADRKRQKVKIYE